MCFYKASDHNLFEIQPIFPQLILQVFLGGFTENPETDL